MLKLYKYNPDFINQFATERDRLNEVLGDEYIIEHVGSTAVPGLDGKGIIDILIGCDDFDQIKMCAEKLVKNGYFWGRNKSVDPNYIFLASSEKDTTIGDFHIHLALKDSKFFMDYIKIRDYLRNNPDVAKKYSDLKYKIAESTDFDRQEYKKQKSQFIEEILKTE